jgi:hypothetical protein
MIKSPIRAVLLAALLLLPLGACQWQSLTPQQDADLRGVFDQLHRGDLAGLEAAYDPQYRPATLNADLARMQSEIPPGQPQIQQVNHATETDKQGRLNYGASYEYDYPGTALLAQIEMRQDKAGHKAVTNVFLRPADPHLIDRYRFNLTGKKPYQYIFLFLVALAPFLGFWGMVAVWRAHDLPRKWKPIWTLAMALGFMDLTMDWTNGSVVLTVANLHVLYVTARHFSPLSPWMISTSLPLASIAFLLGYRPTRLERPWDGPKKPS